MGRMRRTRNRHGISRRHFLKGAGAASAALGLAPLAAGAARLEPAAAAGAFAHGIASGDPLSDRVMLWTRIGGSQATSESVAWIVARDKGLADVVASGTALAEAADDYTVKVDVTGLKPGTHYYYRFTALGVDSAVGRTKTLPVGGVERLRIAFMSCSNYANGYFNAYRRIAERDDLDLVIHLGDYIYEYGTGQYGTTRPCAPDNEIVSLSDYRTRHAQYKSDADLQELHRLHPMIAIWDDHETANNAWREGAENHQAESEGAWSTRVTNALQAYYEWMPTRQIDPSEPRRNYRSFRIGDLVELFMLEDRLLQRDVQLDGNATVQGPDGDFGVFEERGAFASPKRQMLGARQEQWLFNGLRHSKAQWKFIGQGTMMAQLKLYGSPNAEKTSKYLFPDQWDGYAGARDRLFRSLAGDAGRPAVNDVVVLTGDIHTSWASDLTPDPNNPDVANGGYDAATGEGSLAVELVCPSITSQGLIDLQYFPTTIQSINPHIKYVDLYQHGYVLLDIQAERLSAQWWYVDTVAEPNGAQHLGASHTVLRGQNRISPST